MKLIQAAMTKIEPTREQIMAMVDHNLLAEIKRTDPDPTLMAFSIAHEGMSRPNVVGEGPMEIVWNRDSVASMTDKLQMNTELYNRHPQFEGEKREPIARVIGKGQIEAANGLNAVAVAYVPKQHKAEAEKADFASIEAEVEFTDPPAGMASKVRSLFVKAVEAISGIAIGMREKFRPGFPESQKLASITAYIYAYDEETPGKGGSMTVEWDKIDPEDVPWAFFKRVAKKRSAHLSDIWDIENEILPNIEVTEDGALKLIGGDRNLEPVVKSLSGKIAPALRKQYEAELAAKLGTDSEGVAAAMKELAQLKSEKARNEALPKLETMAKEAGLDQIGINFVKKQAEALSDFSDESALSEFVAKKVGEWEQIAGPIKKPEPTEPEKPRPALGPQGTPGEEKPLWAKDLPDPEL